MPQYLLSVHGADSEYDPAGGLRSASTATVVDGTGEKPTYTDGPYLESKEYLGGFWVIEAADLDVALRIAAEGSAACRVRSRYGRSRAWTRTRDRGCLS